MAQVTIEQAIQIAIGHHQSGRLPDAEQLYRQVLAQQPHHADAMHLLGLLVHQSRRDPDAVKLISRAISTRPGFYAYHNSLGTVLLDQNQPVAALSSFSTALQMNPHAAETHNNLGNALLVQKQFHAAAASYRKAIELKPEMAQAHFNLANTLKVLADLKAATAEFRTAIQFNPGFSNAHNNLGAILVLQGSFEEAIVCLREAIRINPNYAEAYSNLGNALRKAGKLDDATSALQAALRLKPDFPDAHYNFALTMKETGELDESIKAFQTAMALNPANVEFQDDYLLTLLYLFGNDQRTIHQEHVKWNALHAAPLKSHFKPHQNDADPARQLRIGYISGDFCNHPVLRFVLPLLANHDRRRFEIFCYSNTRNCDSYTDRAIPYADTWRDIVNKSDSEVAEIIRQDKIDILIDLSLHTGYNRLLVFAEQPAPVQATFAGYPGTTGLDSMQYRITDPYLDPPGSNDAFYSEESLYLQNCFWCCAPFDDDLPVTALPAETNGFVTFGCLNNFSKINPSTVGLWSKILSLSPGSRFVMFGPAGRSRERTSGLFQSHGIDSQRIQYVERTTRAQYMALYHSLDIALDSFPYNGHATTVDALWMGVPVVSLTGKSAVSRGGHSILSNIGLPEFASQSEEQFISFAVTLSSNLPKLSDIRANLRKQMLQSPLMDGRGFAKDFESLCRSAWQRWCEGRTANVK